VFILYQNKLRPNPMKELICDECKEVFFRYLCRIKATIKRDSKHIWCSKECHGLWLKRNYI
jgi:hypothetical protein